MHDYIIRHESVFAVRFGTSVIRRFLVGIALVATMPIAAAAMADADASAPWALLVESGPTSMQPPLSAETREASLLVNGHPLPTEHTSGIGDRNEGQPVLAFDATDLDFGTAAPGDSSGWRMTLLTNTGTADATDLQFSTDPEFPWPSIQSWQPCYGRTVLSSGGACLIAMKFAPSASGQVDGTLSVSSAEGAAASLDLTGVGSEESVLYGQFHDWSTQESLIGLLNSHFRNVPSRNSEFADDFEVAASSSWIIGSVGVELVAPDRPAPPSVDVYVMQDASGLPGDTPVCTALASEIALWEPPVDESRALIRLSSPCTLAPGHYWLRIMLTVDDETQSLFWGLQFTQKAAALPSGDPPPTHLHSPVWRNPEGGVGYQGCSDWTSVLPPNCGLENYPSSVYTFYGSVFWIIGRKIVIDPVFSDGFEALPPLIESSRLPR
jgi:hypothetical protein